MRFARTSKIVGVATLSALALSACGGGGDTSSSGGSGNASAIITADSVEPQNPLVPTNTAETGGGRIVQQIFHGLITYDENGKPVNDLAESIESKDNKTWTIKIKPGKKFSNDEVITAKSFVDSWNFAAAAKNAQQGSYFFESVEGYDKVSAEGSKEDTMSGLKVVDDNTFTVTLSHAESDFPLRLGYSAYTPMPSVAFKDIKAFGENPIGYGPYKMAKQGAWQHNVQVELVKNDSYDGPDKAQNGGITFKLYQKLDAAYQDVLANNLDVLEQLPTSALANAKSDLGDRYQVKPYAAIQEVAIPYYLENFKGEAGKLRRQAISMAINRTEIGDVIFHGTLKAATEFTSPALEGYQAEIPGSEFTKFDAAKAKELWAKAEKIKPYNKSEKLTIAYNADGGHKDWIDALANQLKNNLGIDAEGKSYATFKEVRTEANKGTLTGAIRSGWVADYPSAYNFLGATLAKGAASNDARYDNPAFEAKLREGLSATDKAARQKAFTEANSMALNDMPAIPLFYYQANYAYSENVSNVTTDWQGTPIYFKITKK